MEHLPTIDDELTRGSAWVTLWDSVLIGDVKPAAFLDLAIAALRVETNELNVNRLLAYVREAYWRHTEPLARRPLARRFEPVLRAGLAAASTPSLKSVWFSALRDIAELLQESQELLFSAPRLAIVPGIAIAVAVLGFNLLGDGLRDHYDPRLEDRR